MFSSNTSQTSGGYEIQRSLRFNSADSAFLNRTLGSPTSASTWTLSLWFKRSSITSSEYQYLWSYDSGGAAGIAITSSSDANPDVLYLYNGSTINYSTGLRRLRDPSAWYHVVVSCSAGSATVYLNGSSTATISSVSMPNMSLGIASNIGRYTSFGGVNYFSGYMTEVNFIDGQALTPSSFGAFDAQTGVWGPTRYAGSYGTNGFYLNFSDNSNTTAATLGRDYSGNGNNWTPNNFSVSAGAGNDSLVDSPTSYGTDTGVGGTVRGNYCTLNPLDKGALDTTNGNLDFIRTSVQTDWEHSRATFQTPSTGKWYWEVTFNSGTTDGIVTGVCPSTFSLSSDFASSTYANVYAWGTQPLLFSNNSNSTYGSSPSAGGVIMCAFDRDNSKIYFGLNGTWFNSSNPATQTNPAASSIPADMFPFCGSRSTGNGSSNFGQRPFAYTAPSGFKALNTQNLPTPTIGATTATQAGKYFNAVLYTGTGSSRSVTGVGFQPDFTWIKDRTSAEWHRLYDAVRGATKELYSNTTNAEGTDANGLSAFNSDGFSVGTLNAVNKSADAFVAWNWKANGAGVTNTAGSITSTVSANTTSGFSVVTFAAAASSTVGHGLGVAPSMVVVKSRTVANNFWLTYHVSTGPTGFLAWNTTDAFATNSTVWNNTAPTSSVFTIGSGFINANYGNCVAYCFAEVPGYSRFGSYTANASTDGPFCFTGFRPRFVMFKRSSVASNWAIHDNARSPFNTETKFLFPNDPSAEVDSSSYAVDFLSNGFKVRSTGAETNQNFGETYIFAAFAEAPQKFALAR